MRKEAISAAASVSRCAGVFMLCIRRIVYQTALRQTVGWELRAYATTLWNAGPRSMCGVSAMDRATISTVLALVCASGMVTAGALVQKATAADAPAAPKPPAPVVHLYGAADLEHLRETNFNHYQRAKRIIADGNKLCRPGAPTLQLAARYGADDMSCAANLLTSNPPKKILGFRLDSTRYVAHITITNDQPRLIKAH